MNVPLDVEVKNQTLDVEVTNLPLQVEVTDQPLRVEVTGQPLRVEVENVKSKTHNPAVSSLKCPKCGSQQVRRSRRRGVERLLSLARIYPFRCEHCCERFLTVRRWNRCKTA
jgi:hypothetical protein